VSAPPITLWQGGILPLINLDDLGHFRPTDSIVDENIPEWTLREASVGDHVLVVPTCHESFYFSLIVADLAGEAAPKHCHEVFALYHFSSPLSPGGVSAPPFPLWQALGLPLIVIV